jgi:hypothetical protein
MNTNGPKPSQDPKNNANDPTKFHGNEPLHNNPTKPYSSEPTTPLHSEHKTSYQDKSSMRNSHSEQPGSSKTEQWGEKIKTQTEQVGDKIKGTFKQLKDSRQVDDLYNYAVSNKEKTIAYTLLALGLIILLFVDDLFGGLIIGLVAGYYYSREIVYFIRNLPQFFEGQDQVRYVVALVLVIGLLFVAPGIILGAAVLAAFKQIINRNEQGMPDMSDKDTTGMNRPGNGNGNQGNQRNSVNKDNKGR